MPNSAGATAGVNGNELESFVENVLVNKGYKFVFRTKFKATTYLEQPIYAKQFVVSKTIYQTKLQCDFIIYHPEKHPESLVIECKWQQSGGTVDEKYPYLVLNIKTKSPYKTVLLLDGGGYRKNAEKWLREQTDRKLLHVFNMMEFQTWSNKGNI